MPASLFRRPAAMPAQERNSSGQKSPRAIMSPFARAVIVLRSSKSQELARRLEVFVTSAEALAILKRHGFEAPGSTAQR